MTAMLRRTLWLLVLLLLPAATAQNGTANETADALVDEREPLLPTLLEDELHRLPAVAQDGAGLFVASLLAWVVIAFLVMLVVAPTLKWLAARTPTHLDGVIIGIVSTPGFLLVFTFGLVDSLAVFDLPAWGLAALERIWHLVVVVVLTYVVYRAWHEVILDVGKHMSRKTATSLDDKLYPLFDKIGGVIIIIAGVWFIVASFGINMTFFAAGGAIGGLVIAFAAQDTLANFFAGVHLLVDQPFREGDRIEIQEEDTWGDVVDIGLRATRIRTRDNRLVIVPNSVIANNLIINHSFPDTEYRLSAKVGVAYGTPLEKARRTLIDAVQGVEGVEDREVQALFRNFGDSSLDFDVRYWIRSYLDTRIIEDRVNTAINDALAREAIEIPFPQRVLWSGAKPDAAVL